MDVQVPSYQHVKTKKIGKENGWGLMKLDGAIVTTPQYHVLPRQHHLCTQNLIAYDVNIAIIARPFLSFQFIPRDSGKEVHNYHHRVEPRPSSGYPPKSYTKGLGNAVHAGP